MDFFQQVYKGKNNWWRYLLLSLVVFTPFFLRIFYFLFVEVKTKPTNLDSNFLLFKGLQQYVVFFVVLILGVRFLHKRPIRSLFTSKKKIDWWRYIFGVSSWGLFVLIYFSLNYFAYPESYRWNFKLVPFAILFLISITLVPIGAIFKELFFSGYLLQVFGVLTKNKWTAIILKSILYVLAVGISPIFSKVGFHVLFFYLASSLFTGIITALDDGVELAMGMQTANNIFAILYITTTWTGFQTNALLLDRSEPKVLFLVYIPVLLFLPIYFFLLKQMYGWERVKEKLSGKVIEPSIKNINL
ncbi:hypothetical protein WH52_06050 [Tenacibaculum holothuriorum]|uniref:CAAX prenyl protease 2/Lysostaphin resistance protein A-like domain-containing protein n=1 Tax=Tenacibaculum holothuriorum TaxID=1635173 RepID=A0A1Y2PD14_9FLAO|nr:CPBP family glutamic-type intramembrane protease [Tenacibaculum holothuriorum]OSY88325.1 hypothetical protein WH52_06050 [Tenacibaculum holothuriorum]